MSTLKLEILNAKQRELVDLALIRAVDVFGSAKPLNIKATEMAFVRERLLLAESLVGSVLPLILS